MSEFKINGKSLSELSSSIQQRKKEQPDLLKKGRNDGELRELCMPASRLRTEAKNDNSSSWVKRAVGWLFSSTKNSNGEGG